MKLNLVAVLGLSFLAVGCGKSSLEGTYQGTNNISLQPTGQSTGMQPGSSIESVSLIMTENGKDTLTGTMSSTSGGNNLVGNNTPINSSAQLTGTVSDDGNGNRAITLNGVQAKVRVNNAECIAVMSGVFNTNQEGTVMNGTVTGEARNTTYSQTCGTLTFALTLTRQGNR
jgi:hypothetical protein